MISYFSHLINNIVPITGCFIKEQWKWKRQIVPLLGWPDVPLPSRCTGTGCDAWLDREELCLLARHCSCFKTVLCWKSPPGKTCRPEGLFKAIWIQNNLIDLCWKLQGQMITCNLTYTCSKALFWELTTCLRRKEIKDIDVKVFKLSRS